MGLSGTLHTFPLADLLQWMGGAGKTGTLVLRAHRFTKRIYFKAGTIVSSASDDPTEQLGQYLLRHCRITEEQLKEGLERQSSTGVLLGRALLDAGLINEDELKRVLVAKAEESIFSVFLWHDAHFDFLDGDLPERLFVPISLNVQDVLLKGFTMVDELRHVREDLGSSGSIIARTPKPIPTGLQSRPLARAVIDLIDGRRTIAGICLALHASEFTIGKLLHQLLEQGFIVVEKKAPPEDTPTDQISPLPAEKLVARARERLGAGEPGEAVGLLHQAVAASPRDLDIKKLLDQASAAFRDQAVRELQPEQKIPSLARDLTELTGESLTPEEMFIMSRINGSWDLKSIIDISPLEEVEALRIVKRLLERKLIVLT